MPASGQKRWFSARPATCAISRQFEAQDCAKTHPKFKNRKHVPRCAALVEDLVKIGYARKSTAEQRLDLQTDALERAGCERIFSDSASGARDDREGLANALAAAQPGDILVVWKIDRLGRSLTHLIETINGLGQRGVGFHSLTENIETVSPGGRLVLAIFAALSEFERSLIVSRTQAGLEAARARGRFGGRPEKMDDRKISAARRLLADPSVRIDDVCNAMQVSRSTLYRHLGKNPVQALIPSTQPTENSL
jgi:DNA invertase Pin-like site-specific DNA recombinase